MIDELVEDLKADEGWEPSVYKDHLGYLSLGFGFLVDERRGGEIPLKIAEDWLVYAATERWNQLVNHHPWLQGQPEDVQRALGNMCYNLGVGGVSNFKNMLQALKDGDRNGAADEALDSRWATQVPERAKRVAALIRGENVSEAEN